MSKSGLIFTGICVAVALAFLVPALGFPGGSSDGAPGPGYFPIIVSTAILILSLILGVGYIRKKEVYFQKNEAERRNLPYLLATGGSVIVYTIFFTFLPYIPLTLVFLGFLNWLYKRTWKFNIIFSVLFTGISYLVFSKLLHVMLK